MSKKKYNSSAAFLLIIISMIIGGFIIGKKFPVEGPVQYNVTITIISIAILFTIISRVVNKKRQIS